MSDRFRYGLFFLIPLVVVLDQWSKWLILKAPVFNALGCLDRSQACGRVELSSVFDLSMVWNRGVSFGVAQSEGVMRWVMVGVIVMIAIGFGVWLMRAARTGTGIALALVVGGAIGNVIDRVRFGAVVDFLDFSGIYFIWVFNVADAAISVGAVLLFVDQFLMSRSESSAGTETKS